MEKQRVQIVTGGAGFIGHHLVNTLIERGEWVIVIDNLSTGKVERVPKSVKLLKLDLSVDEIPNLPYQIDTVYHLAATTSVEESLVNPNKYKNHILNATTRVLLWAANQGARRVVMASTAAVYGNPEWIPTPEYNKTNPLSPYAEWKLEAERVMESFHAPGTMTTACLRFFNVFGEGQPSTGSYAPAVARFMKQYESYNPITVTGDGSQTRDYVYVKDIVDGLIKAAEKDHHFVVNLGSGEELSILEIAEAFGGEIMFIPPRIEPKRSCADITEAWTELGWKPSTNVIKWIHQIK